MSEFEQYRSLFVAESRENHENLVNYLLALEKGIDQTAIDEIFRSIHTLKGASASMGFADMERLCHTMEDALQLIRSGSAEMSEDLGNVLLSCTDLIEEMLDDIETGGDSSSKNPDKQVHALRIWLEAQDTTGGPDKPRESPEHKTESCEPEAVQVEDAEQGTGVEYTMTIIVSPDCMMKDVRAMIAIQNLEALGTIRSLQPSKEEIDEGKFDGTAKLTIFSDAGEVALRTAAQGSEISTVEIQATEEASAVAAVPTPGKKPAEPDRKQTAAADKNREIKNLRVDISQLDHIMNLVEDLVINRGRLKQIAEERKIKEMDEAISMVERSVSELQNLMMIIRMIPLSHIFNRLPRVVRDVAQYDHKEVEFIMEGGDTELDRSVMDGLNDPLLHLIRNAVNHGIEDPETRIKAGKPGKGLVRLSARRDRDNVIIQLTDDGAGINVEKVKKKAVEKGLISPEAAATLRYLRRQSIYCFSQAFPRLILLRIYQEEVLALMSSDGLLNLLKGL